MMVKNEWDLLLLVRARLAAGEATIRFAIQEPVLWTMFSRRPALVLGPDNTRYELSPDFPRVMHELIRWHISSHVVHQLPRYELYFQPSLGHRHYSPATGAEVPAEAPRVVLTSPEDLRAFLDDLSGLLSAPGDTALE
ncbi:hypothetical protein [Hymenobacter metallicola]|uniref:Uncharacterized protein n=1 Tax=Hymenobacter metallicola TaxID=2563114 RepID=A0A4Z0QFD7_9BACT|nr:hypothetical protein [Hymenobacter metallicola]TGE27903.1 hypothetical protein E5K02_00105 [Hymenobacter metallicola]